MKRKCIDLIHCEPKPEFPDLQGILLRYEENERALHRLLSIEPKKITGPSSKSLYFEHKHKLIEIVFEDELNKSIDHAALLVRCPRDGTWSLCVDALPLLNVYYMKTLNGATMVFTFQAASMSLPDDMARFAEPNSMHPPSSLAQVMFTIPPA